MSTPTDAILAYGIDLGEGIDWEELGYVHVEDCEYDYKECGNCFENEAEFLSARLKVAGITGVGLTRHYSLSSPMWLLTSREIGAYDGDVVKLNKERLNVPALETLAIGEAARVLGVAADVTPQWLLVAFWTE